MERLAPRDLFVPHAVVAETSFLLPHEVHRRRVAALVNELSITPCPQESEAGYWAQVCQWLLMYSDHQPDWADGCIAVLSGLNRRWRVWTYDREFVTIWRRPDGSRIPLAVTASAERR